MLRALRTSMVRRLGPLFATPWLLACLSDPPPPPSAFAGGSFARDSIRYRLELRNNAVDPAEAFRCFGGCQQTSTQEAYVECLSSCPGFEETPGARCTEADVTPSAVCITVRTGPPSREPNAGAFVAVILGSMVLSVVAANLCVQQNTACFTNWQPGLAPWPAGPQ